MDRVTWKLIWDMFEEFACMDDYIMEMETKLATYKFYACR